MTSFSLRSTFPIFPDGVPGFGLLLLRASVGVALVSSGMTDFVAWQGTRVLILLLAALSVGCGLLLLLGLLNWVACSLSALISLGAALIPVPMLSVSSAHLSAVFTAVIAIALLCLGPGAYSLDARRHGRREIIIPARRRSSDENAS
ncbi:MAG TPA: hypothetical protein VGK96_23420 [Candidatus Sulfotelmatobacter sp.]